MPSHDRAVTHATTLFLTDNGACLCGQHLGASARFTGRDISGQPIEPITPEVFPAVGSDGWVPSCEECGRRPEWIVG